MDNFKEPEITEELIKEHGLTDEEYEKIKQILGRDPNYTELGIFSVMWSEHCSYKSSRVFLKNFPTSGEHIIQGPGENAGIVDIGDGMAIVFKMESHNHPSFIEPYQGAATGVGGILRDIFTMGARPIASLNSLRFGSFDHPKTRYLLNGVVGGISGYGNCIGVPTVGGETYFNKCYNGNILVNVFTLGLVKKERIFKGVACGPGNPVIYVGSKTGRDGIHGATMASEEFDEKSVERRPTVQVGDPFTEKLLLEACLEVMSRDCIVGIQDMGAAGLTCSSCEMASRGGTGIEIDLSKVPRREVGMIPYELMLSESQERMLLVVKEGHEKEVEEVFKKWDLDVSVVGSVTDDGLLRVMNDGVMVAEIPARALSEESPVYLRPKERPEYLSMTQRFSVDNLPEPTEYTGIFLKLLGSPNIASKGWVYGQYDHMVRTNTVVLPGSDAAVIRVKGTNKGIAMTVDCNSRYCYLDPYVGGMIAVAEAARNLVCSGAKPLAITDCLNFGNPEKPEIMWQFEQATNGISDACKRLNTPVVGGNVSFYNETQGEGIYPTPTVAMVGIIPDINLHQTQWFKDDGDVIVMLGKIYEELGGSEYLAVVHGIEEGMPPGIELDLEIAVQNTCLEVIQKGIIKSAHDCSEGGIAVALAECCFSGPKFNRGATVNISKNMRGDCLLFGESQSRIIVSLDKGNLDHFKEIAGKNKAPFNIIGRVGGDRLVINELIDCPVEVLKQRWKRAIEERV
ncbi:MAG: phosphoribosylformylglycinamidine synthase subunit PurL [Deltaproteobacteria bacterium CG_4_9_14_3_um_filter_44_9]|nr:MAG: phosphoribosylformylglycinamidine synthase II [Deltaproteobacteria bacterium CG2_30_43_15]PIU84686.1 MAG: phosphoribosylformylglycinamidine synthase subunit PurL [Deltaproteobacteria bacterium CG06_land_8_20_14_3_00_44_19]PIX24894.1 MAG: phosphoribosylformylglycinamidine synthase subunit PurL [Deltaproteobacteria bacterium CG_4_8_14_3_um_filter_43_13]PIZ19657.1 MAG: phosphoribosylformylglycinamidine synthase subunit PurL [Deltaproteobacteria bacterium CG_4_10_14_0_8_um_filter_43_12]PJB3